MTIKKNRKGVQGTFQIKDFPFFPIFIMETHVRRKVTKIPRKEKLKVKQLEPEKSKEGKFSENLFV